MNCNNCEDIYPQSDMTRWESCSSSIIADADNYYTKHQVDELIEGASGCCITPEEVDEKISAATEATEQWVEDQHYITGVDLSDYALKSDIPTDVSAFNNDSGYITQANLSGYAKSSAVTQEISAAVSGKQDTLTAGSGISIVNNVISATGGGGGIVDPSLDGDSPNAVANSAITEALNDKLDITGYTQPIQSDWNQTNNGKLDYIKNKPTIPEVPTEISSFHNDVGYITTASTIFNNYATTANTYTKQEVDNKFACMTEQEYQNLPIKDPKVLYLIHD